MAMVCGSLALLYMLVLPLDEVLADLHALPGCDGKRIANGDIVRIRLPLNDHIGIGCCNKNYRAKQRKEENKHPAPFSK